MYFSYIGFNVIWVVYVMASLALSESQRELTVQAECNQNISMKCEALDNNMHRSITWYKLNSRTGIIRRTDNKDPDEFDYPRPARLGENDSLVLPRVRPEDSGTYECLIRANIGYPNIKSLVFLNVSTVCDHLTTMTAMVEMCPNTTHSSPMYHIQVLDVSTIWASCGFLIMSLVKIPLCILSIRVFVKIKKSKKQMQW